MTRDAGTGLVTYTGVSPRVAPDAFLAAGATLVGDVTGEPRASIWFGAIVRGDGAPIRIGPDSNVQDGAVLHSDPDFPVTVGAHVSIGHRAVVHGCTVGDDCLIGMGAIVLNGAIVGRGSLVAAGSVVLEGTTVPPDSLAAGVPAKVKRPVTDAERDRMRSGAASYVSRAATYRDEQRAT